jgi:RNA polymerase sigma-70 factor (ECF subfamily)
MLRARTARREVPLDAPVPTDDADPEREAELADSVGLALLVVLDTLSPAERLAFVLHDMFAVPFDEIAAILGRSTGATKMLASRARRRVRTGAGPGADLARRRAVVEAFLLASRTGDFGALLNLLDPGVEVRADAFAAGGAPVVLRGAEPVGRQALLFAHQAAHARVALVDGAPAILVEPRGRLVTAMTFAIANDRITGIEIIADPGRLASLVASPS